MDALILALYAFIVWLIFFKFKWLPWNTTAMVIVVTIPIVGLTITIAVVFHGSHLNLKKMSQTMKA